MSDKVFPYPIWDLYFYSWLKCPLYASFGLFSNLLINNRFLGLLLRKNLRKLGKRLIIRFFPYINQLLWKSLMTKTIKVFVSFVIFFSVLHKSLFRHFFRAIFGNLAQASTYHTNKFIKSPIVEYFRLFICDLLTGNINLMNLKYTCLRASLNKHIFSNAYMQLQED